MASKAEPIWTLSFFLLCSTQLLGYAHNSMLTPTLPLYVTHLGGSAFLVGLTLAAFSVTSVFLRPLIGYWADSWSYVGVMALGSLFLGLSILLWLVPLLELVMVGNAFRGIAWAGLNTGGYCLLANTAPDTRRGEAAGYYGGFQSFAAILLPSVALWLLDVPWGGFQSVILTSTALAVAGAILGSFLKSSTAQHQPPGPSHGAAPYNLLRAFTSLDQRILLASALLLCLILPLSAAHGFVVLYAREAGITRLGWYFVVSGSTQLLARPLLGSLSDRVGRAQSIMAGLLLEISGLLTFLMASSLPILVVGGCLYAAGMAVGTASTMALAMEWSDPRRRGVGMATFSTALPMGMGVGAIVAGIAVELVGYAGMFIVIAALVSSGFLLIFLNWSTLSPSR